MHLASLLTDKARGVSSIEVQITTWVSKPNDVFDMFGRFIGDVHVAGTNLNHWMLAQGWAFPRSMTLSSQTRLGRTWTPRRRRLARTTHHSAGLNEAAHNVRPRSPWSDHAN